MKLKIKGISYRDPKAEIPLGANLTMVNDPLGEYTKEDHDDPKAISVWYEDHFIGYIPRDLNYNKFKSLKVVRVVYKELKGDIPQPVGDYYAKGAYVASVEASFVLDESAVYHNIEQGTDKWFKLRAGHVTSSKVSVITAWGKNKFGFPAIEYAHKLAIEKVKGWQKEETFKNEHMERGNDLEPEAIKAYEKEKNVKVSNGGVFVAGLLADSPDGVVNEGIIEVKSVIQSVHEKNIKRNAVDPAYSKQVQFHIWVTQKPWCDFISYCPEHETPLHIVRVYRDDTIIEEMRECIVEFNKLVNMNVKLLTWKKK